MCIAWALWQVSGAGKAGLGSVHGQTQTHRALLATDSPCCHPSWLPGILGVGGQGFQICSPSLCSVDSWRK